MKRLGCFVLMAAISAPAWSAGKKVTAQELKDMLMQLQQQKKGDDEVATALKQVEMSEMLTPDAMNGLNNLLPGQSSLAQVYILEARSSMLPAPAADLPNDPAPDAAAQKALLDKANDYVAKTYSQLPDLAATKTTLRFQDNMDTVASSSGMNGSATDVSVNSGLGATAQFFRYVASIDSPVAESKGVEKFTMPKDKDRGPWGGNGMMSPEEQGPVLATVLSEAQAASKISFARWELVNGKKAAVFNFVVDKKKSHYAVNYCCYPDTDQAGMANFQSASAGSARGSSGGGAGGNFQTNTNWKMWKSNVPYHGEIFINADTGIVVRIDSFAEFKPSDVVHKEDTRIDFDPVTIADKTLVVPTKSFTSLEDVPKGEDSSGKFSLRHTLLYAEYKNYQLAGGH